MCTILLGAAHAWNPLLSHPHDSREMASAPITNVGNDRTNTPDADLEIALQLHRELNAPERRSRRQADDDSAPSNKTGLHRLAGSSRPALRHRKRSATEALEPHEVAADAAMRKAARVSKTKPPNHVKAFLQGIPWGCAILRSALQDRDSLAKAVERAFGREGVACDVHALDVVAVTWEREAFHFRAENVNADVAGSTDDGQRCNSHDEQDGVKINEGDDVEAGESKGWKETMEKATRLYISVPPTDPGRLAEGGLPD